MPRHQTTGLKEYHQSLKSNGLNLYYNNRVHAKMIIIDKIVGIVSSMNFFSDSSSGKSWESGIVTTQDDAIQDMILAYEKLKDTSDTKAQ